MAESRRVVVTGGSSGIGAATVAQLRLAGNRVINVDRHGGDITADLSTQEGREDAARRIAEVFPDGFDALVTCAGVMGPQFGGKITSAVNFFGTTRLAGMLRPLLARGKDPRVVLLSSIASIGSHDPELLALYLADDEAGAVAHTDDWLVAYTTGKRALSHWVRRNSVAPEWAGAGILLNAVAPGMTITGMTQGYDADASDAKERLAETMPIAVAAYAGPEDIAPVVVFMASPANGNMVGQVVFVDGGHDVLTRGENVP